MRPLVPLPLALLAASALAGACEPKETNTDLCRDVYTALCHRAFECEQVDELNACLVYYREDCRVRRLHRNVAEPTDSALAACVAAIADLDCETLDPTALPECPFLVQPEPDAGVDGGDGDGDADDGGGD